MRRASLARACLAGAVLVGLGAARPASAGEAEPGRSVRASWYGGNHHGQRTASGEIFDRNALTAAHRSLPFGTVLRVTNPPNARQVLVRINDRGPFRAGRSLDLAEGAARRLGVAAAGVALVRIEPIPAAN